MSLFKIYNEQNAPEQSRKTLEGVKKAYGFIPNLLGSLAESPASLDAYLDLGEKLSKSSLSPTEQQVLFLSISHENECDYCMAAHSTIAQGSKIDDSIINSLRNNEKIQDEKLQALSLFTKKVVEQRGWVSEDDVHQFIEYGYTRQSVLEVILAVSMKTISNYSNHILKTPVDTNFQHNLWEKE